MTTATTTDKGSAIWIYDGMEGWPGIVSRFQLVRLAGRRSKQLLRGARPRIPVDLKRRNTSIALEELRRGLVPFMGQNGKDSSIIPTAIDNTENMTVVDQARDFGLPKAE